MLDDKARKGLIGRTGVLSVRPSARRPFTRVRYHDAVLTRRALATATSRQQRRSGLRAAATATSTQAEVKGAASEHLARLLGERTKVPAKRRKLAAAATSARNYAPKLRSAITHTTRMPRKRAVRVVSYQQTHRDIPIFGARADVELDERNSLVAAHAKLAHVTGVSRKPKLPAKRAGELLADAITATPEARREIGARSPELTFFHERHTNQWHLAYVFSNVPARPRAPGEPVRRKRDGHGIGPSPRQRFPVYDYLVDATTGKLVYYYSCAPTAAKKAAPGPIPSKQRGLNDEGSAATFFGLSFAKGFRLHDPARWIRTHDLADGDMDAVTVPKHPLSSASPNWGNGFGAGISAHVNSGHVFDYFSRVLFRRGIDDDGMEVVNVVNCTSPLDEDPPQWTNAVWYRKKMWYGQTIHQGKRRSLARHLDIVAHELTHGVIEATCNLVYREESGALNESFSDIFGVIVKNAVKRPDADPRDWEWEIGPGLGETTKKPLRDLSNPKRTGDPAHAKDMWTLKPGEQPNEHNDDGYVHSNSNIHNKAAYNLLVATVPGKKRKKRPPLVFEPDDVARLYYYTLQRIDRTADFEDVYFMLLDVARTLFPDEAEQTAKLAAITRAYGAVGIPRS